MIQRIRKSKVRRFIAFYLALSLMVEIIAPTKAYALTGGPAQPEFNSFTPIGTSDMVDLSSGDFSYNIPIMDVGGYPINMAYSSNVSMDQEASWVGLGWDLSIGQINRQMRGLPDDFNGDEMIYENNLKDNITAGGQFAGSVNLIGLDEVNEQPASDAASGAGSSGSGSSGSGSSGSGSSGSGSSGSGSSQTPPANATSSSGNISLSVGSGFGVTINNYTGFDYSIQRSINLGLAKCLNVGMELNSSGTDGVSVSPTIGFSKKLFSYKGFNTNLGINAGTTYNSRKGMENISINKSLNYDYAHKVKGRYGTGTSGSFKVNSNISFVDASYTPSKRVGMRSSSYTYSAQIGGEIWGIEPSGKLIGFRTKQGIRPDQKVVAERAYGYENTWNADDNDVLDFNREKDRTFSVNTRSLPITNYTYDIYSIQGQGIGGMFRAYNSQVGYVYDRYVEDDSEGGAIGAEVGFTAPTNFRAGVDVDLTSTDSHTSVWKSNNPVLAKFKESKNGNKPSYEKVYFKNIGGNHVDSDYATMFENGMGGYRAVKQGITGSSFNWKTSGKFEFKNGPSAPTAINISAPLKRTERVNRGQLIQRLTREEAVKYGFNTIFSPYSKVGKHDSHTSEIRILKDGGERYIYGRAAYNITKKEVTFDVSGRAHDGHTGLVTYNPGVDNSIKNNAYGDRYFDAITTPAYGHSFLLTSVLSNDYSDLTGDGPSDDDLGSYTRFVYNHQKTLTTPYKWRLPYGKNKANYDEGLKSSQKDDKGNYIYGEKELLYLDTIVTKTHIAIFEISPRKDAYGVDNENGGGSLSTQSRMYKLDKITLYSKPEFLDKGTNATPIKTAHFIYDYSLCTGVPNNFNSALTENERGNQGGKLTLKEVYFTYGKSNMGRYTPYKFNYANNKPYDQRASDSWGNYKPNDINSGTTTYDVPTNAEYAFTSQLKEEADDYNTAWLLKDIFLPSGGKINVDFESDDYGYVQDKEAMQMFKVVGVGNSMNATSISDITKNQLYTGPSDINDVLYIKLTGSNDDEFVTNITTENFIDKYIKDLTKSPIYFRFLLNMSKPGTYEDRYDYVTGYLELANEYKVIDIAEGKYAAIKIKTVNKGDGFNADNNVNPISKAGWNFGRQYLNNIVYNNPSDEVTNDLVEILNNIVDAYTNVAAIFNSPNRQLLNNRIASRFVAGKAWIRLMNPTMKKYGGGSRVKQIKIYDNWDVMTSHAGDEDYLQYYGQEYTYGDEINTSGVASYEPLGNKENPLVQPFYDTTKTTGLLGPDEQNYVEKPFGECFYPSPKVTYGSVTVKNLSRERTENNTLIKVKRHATGKMVTQFFTSKDYPTLVEYTDMFSKYNPSNVTYGLFNISSKNHITLSQGFLVHTNDMDGKMKAQYVYAEGKDDAPISGSEYFYEDLPIQTDANNGARGKLNNNIITIDSKGNVLEKLVGVDYDCINDFRENKTNTTSGGISVNVAVNIITTPVPIPIVIPTPLPNKTEVESLLRSSVVTKVIHTAGILRKQRVFDAGSNVYTRNLAWDAETGEVLLTETINEFNDKYYSFSYPAYWGYEQMAQAAKNIDLEWNVKFVGGTEYRYSFNGAGYSAANFLSEGDEVWIKPETMPTDEQNEIYREELKAYVVNISNNVFTLISEDGQFIKKEVLDQGSIKVIRSGRRNMFTATMASITSMINPLDKVVSGKLPVDLYKSNTWQDYRIVNASAVEYKDEWPAQCECYLPKMKYNDGKLEFDYSSSNENALQSYNPYKYNIKGNWRANKSFAYLTGRNSETNTNIRTSGFYNAFRPYYIYNSTAKKWVVYNTAPGYVSTDVLYDKWKFASQITQYSPFGFEVENKDALGNYSSAVYGYNYRFPVAVAANTRYSQLAADGFEDYGFSKCDTTAHFSTEGSLIPYQVYTTSEQSHTGTKSLKVLPGMKASVKKQIQPCTDNSGVNN